jgi:hypothetical protein
MSTFDAREFYDIGKKIAEAYADEAGFRTAIGRAYYACHLVGVRATSNKGWFVPKYTGDDHSGLWRSLRLHGQRPTGDKLRELYVLREHADYHVTSRTGECTHCDSVEEGASLTDADAWQTADAIAKDILPRLESINPKTKKA